jgi:hypothetical protein
MSSLNVTNGIGYDPLFNIYKIPDGTYTYDATNLPVSKKILNASYIAPKAGFYTIDACFNLTSNTRTTWASSIETANASNVSFNYRSPYIKTTEFIQNMKEVVRLDAGQGVDATVYCGANVSLTTTGSVFRTSLLAQI